MVETRPSPDSRPAPLRPESRTAPRGRTTAPGGETGGAAGGGIRQRIPTLAQLAALISTGSLVLPRNYRRGMFLDIMA